MNELTCENMNKYLYDHSLEYSCVVGTYIVYMIESNSRSNCDWYYVHRFVS